jgi:hypothetical protein
MGLMAHTLDIGTDLDDLLATIGDLTLDTDTAVDTTVAVPHEGPSLLSPKVIRGAWYR